MARMKNKRMYFGRDRVLVKTEPDDDGLVTIKYMADVYGMSGTKAYWKGYTTRVAVDDLTAFPSSHPNPTTTTCKGFVYEHPWMTFFLGLSALGTVGAIFGANKPTSS